ELPRDERQREGRPVVHQWQPVAIEQDAARRGDGTDADTVLVGGLLEPSSLQNLEIPELADDDEQRAARDARHRHDATPPGIRPPRHPPAEVAESGGAHVVLAFIDSAHVSASTSAAPRKPL